MPGLLDHFLDYHGQLGVEHFTIFDADDTLEEPLKRYSGAVEAPKETSKKTEKNRYKDKIS